MADLVLTIIAAIGGHMRTNFNNRTRRHCYHTARLAIFSLLAAFAADARAVRIDWTPLGDPDNPVDTQVMSDGTSGYGSVAYNYRIGTYDVTNSKYVEFLNAKDASGADPLGLYNNNNMGSAPFGGIDFHAGNASGSKSSVISANGVYPVKYITFCDTLRFANWLNNDQGNGDVGVRVASIVPEPSSLILATLTLVACRRRSAQS